MRSTVLIVEDEQANQRLFRDLLQSRGYAVISATEGREAIRMAIDEKPDLILMDIGLPGMSGLEATELLKADAATKSIPVIVVTAFAMKEDEEKAFKAGCDGFVSKPVDFRQLFEEIERQISAAKSVQTVGSKGANGDGKSIGG